MDIFTMSCRALGRGVEHALLSEVARQARSLTEARALKSSSASWASAASLRAATPCAATPSLPPAEGLLLFRYKTRPDLRNAVNPCRLATGVSVISHGSEACEQLGVVMLVYLLWAVTCVPRAMHACVLRA